MAATAAAKTAWTPRPPPPPPPPPPSHLPLVVGVGGGGTAGAQRLHGDPRSGDEAGALPGAGNERRVRSLFLLVLVLVLPPSPSSLPERAPLDYASSSTIDTAQRWARELGYGGTSATATATNSSTSTSSGGESSERGVLLELRRRLQEAPASPGVYLFRDGTGRLLYIGKSVNLKQRLRSYFRSLPTVEDLLSSPSSSQEEGQERDAVSAVLGFSPATALGRRQATMVRLVRSLDTVVTADAQEALALEAALIRQRQPPFNVLLKDDKGVYPYLCITWSRPYPDIFITRYKRAPFLFLVLVLVLVTVVGVPEHEREDQYLGPFVDSRQLRATLELVKEVFPLRQRFRPVHAHKPCLNYDIGRCPGVCQGLVERRPTAPRCARRRWSSRAAPTSSSPASSGDALRRAAERFERASQLQAQASRLRGNTGNGGGGGGARAAPAGCSAADSSGPRCTSTVPSPRGGGGGGGVGAGVAGPDVRRVGRGPPRRRPRIRIPIHRNRHRNRNRRRAKTARVR